MSRFSGKCDFYDHVFMTSKAVTDEELFEKFKGTKLYKYKPYNQRNELDISTPENLSETIKSNWEEIHYECIADLVPYYPYLISMAFCDNKDSNNSTVVLMSESYIDVSEREMLNIYLKQILKIYNRCKRKKIDFNIEDVVSEVCWMSDKDAITELVKRVSQYGKKANFEDVYLTMGEWYRKELADEMVKHGLNLADYGMKRFEKK